MLMEFKPCCERLGERLHDATCRHTHTVVLFALLSLLGYEISPVQDTGVIHFNAEFYLLSALRRI